MGFRFEISSSGVGLIHQKPHVGQKYNKISLGRPHGRFSKNMFNNGIFTGNATWKVIFPAGYSVGVGKLASGAAFIPTEGLSPRN